MRARLGWLGVVTVALALAVGAPPASATFAGRNGKLVIAPLHGGGLVVAPSRSGRVTRVCDAPQRCASRLAMPRVALDGGRWRSARFAGDRLTWDHGGSPRQSGLS